MGAVVAASRDTGPLHNSYSRGVQRSMLQVGSTAMRSRRHLFEGNMMVVQLLLKKGPDANAPRWRV